VPGSIAAGAAGGAGGRHAGLHCGKKRPIRTGIPEVTGHPGHGRELRRHPGRKRRAPVQDRQPM